MSKYLLFASGARYYVLPVNSNKAALDDRLKVMTANAFRNLALDLPEACESSHMSHPDFRVRGKIFATLGYPDQKWAVVKLTPEQQRRIVRAESELFQPVKGAWGRNGGTQIFLAKAHTAIVKEALGMAWCNTAPKRLIKSS